MRARSRRFVFVFVCVFCLCLFVCLFVRLPVFGSLTVSVRCVFQNSAGPKFFKNDAQLVRYFKGDTIVREGLCSRF
jgi:hypothetical protein